MVKGLKRALLRPAAQLEAALRRARAIGAPVIVSTTEAVDAPADPAAIVVASRRAGEPWFCLEQPDRQNSAIAALGAVRTLEARGPNRFDDLARRWRALVATAVTDEAGTPPGSGLIAVGGFAFADDGCASPAWEGYAAAS